MATADRSVLIVVPFAFHRESGSSLSTFYRVLAVTELSASVDIVTTPHGRDIQNEKITIFRTPGRQFFKSYQPGEYRKRLIYEFFLFVKTIRMLIRGKYSVVIVHGSSIYWAFWLQLFFRAPFIATVHGNIQFELEKWNISSGKFWKKLASRIENMIIGSFYHIIAEHEFVKEILVKSGIRQTKISLIGIAVKGVPPIERKEASDVFNVLYTGTFVKIQNLDLLFSMMDLLRNRKVKLTLIGGVEREIKEARSQAEKLNLTDCIEIIPRLEQQYLMEYFRLADIVVSPREYGFDTPMKIFDYLNYGKCILATDRPIHTGVLNNNIAFLVSPTPEAFAGKILELIAKPKLLIEKEKMAKMFFESNFELHNMISGYRNTLDNVAKK